MGSVVLGVAGLLAVGCAALAYSENEGLERDMDGAARRRDADAKWAQGVLKDPNLGAGDRCAPERTANGFSRY